MLNVGEDGIGYGERSESKFFWSPQPNFFGTLQWRRPIFLEPSKFFDSERNRNRPLGVKNARRRRKYL